MRRLGQNHFKDAAMGLLYTANVHIKGGRSGHARSSNGVLDIRLSPPKELGGKGDATNPEQLFAAGYGACFESALRHVAKNQNIAIGDTTVDSSVELHTQDAGFKLAVTLSIEIEGISQDVAEELVNFAHQVCPYSNAVRNNTVVNLKVKAKP